VCGVSFGDAGSAGADGLYGFARESYGGAGAGGWCGSAVVDGARAKTTVGLTRLFLSVRNALCGVATAVVGNGKFFMTALLAVEESLRRLHLNG